MTLFQRALREDFKKELVHSSRPATFSELLDLELLIEHRLREHRMDIRKAGASPIFGEAQIFYSQQKVPSGDSSLITSEEPMQIGSDEDAFTAVKREDRRKNG